MFILEAEVAQALKQPRSAFLYFSHTFTFLYVGVVLTCRVNWLDGQTINLCRILTWKRETLVAILNGSFSITVHVQPSVQLRHKISVECVQNVMAHAQKPDFVFRRNGRVNLKLRGCQFSRLLAAEVCASAVVMLDTPCSEVV